MRNIRSWSRRKRTGRVPSKSGCCPWSRGLRRSARARPCSPPTQATRAKRISPRSRRWRCPRSLPIPTCASATSGSPIARTTPMRRTRCTTRRATRPGGGHRSRCVRRATSRTMRTPARVCARRASRSVCGAFRRRGGSRHVGGRASHDVPVNDDGLGHRRSRTTATAAARRACPVGDRLRLAGQGLRLRRLSARDGRRADTVLRAPDDGQLARLPHAGRRLGARERGADLCGAGQPERAPRDRRVVLLARASTAGVRLPARVRGLSESPRAVVEGAAVARAQGVPFETWAEMEFAVARATECWNVHRHPFVCGRRQRHRPHRQPGVALRPLG